MLFRLTRRVEALTFARSVIRQSAGFVNADGEKTATTTLLSLSMFSRSLTRNTLVSSPSS
jgi:hypothetical protein